jgi:hypothetical protein
MTGGERAGDGGRDPARAGGGGGARPAFVDRSHEYLPDRQRRRLEERVAALEAALGALVEAWGVPAQDWFRSDCDVLIEDARALLAGDRKEATHGED